MTEDIQTLTKEKIKLEEPSMYDVIFLNDNITTTEFVVRVLKQIFSKTQEQAESIMKYILIQKPGFKEKYFEHLDEFKYQSSEELISIYNQNVRTGIVGVYAQAIMLVAIRFEIKRRFGVSPIKLKDNMILKNIPRT